MSDTIDRQVAITRIDSIIPSKTDSDYQKGISVGMAMAKIAIKDQPSAQPELLTDQEQRIFLAAMGREEKVCKKADEEYYGIDNINLVKVCKEIERKVKKALWTN